MRTFHTLFLLASASVWAAGPPVPRAAPAKAAPAAAKVETAKPSAKPAPVAGPSDADLQRAIQTRFSRSKISADGFTVKVQGGTATIEGHTEVIQHKGTATRLARRAGAKRVDNRIQISEEARQKAAAKLGKARTVAKVKVAKAP